jgi:hypothetical protein
VDGINDEDDNDADDEDVRPAFRFRIEEDKYD